MTAGEIVVLPPLEGLACIAPLRAYIARGNTDKSRETLRYSISLVARVVGVAPEQMPWASLRYEHTQVIRAALADRYAPATANAALCALRGVLKEAWRQGLIPFDHYERARDVRSVPGTRLPRGRWLPHLELERVFENAARERDLALLALLYGAGLRRAEAAGLPLEGFDRTAEVLRIVGKGNKEREVPLPPATVPVLERWIAVRGDSPGTFLRPITKSGRVLERALSPSAIWARVRELARLAGIAHFSPHDLRRTFASNLFDMDANAGDVSRLMGHSQVQTTIRYDRRPDQQLRRTVARLPVPTTTSGRRS